MVYFRLVQTIVEIMATQENIKVKYIKERIGVVGRINWENLNGGISHSFWQDSQLILSIVEICSLKSHQL